MVCSVNRAYFFLGGNTSPVAIIRNFLKKPFRLWEFLCFFIFSVLFVLITLVSIILNRIVWIPLFPLHKIIINIDNLSLFIFVFGLHFFYWIKNRITLLLMRMNKVGQLSVQLLIGPTYFRKGERQLCYFLIVSVFYLFEDVKFCLKNRVKRSFLLIFEAHFSRSVFNIIIEISIMNSIFRKLKIIKHPNIKINQCQND